MCKSPVVDPQQHAASALADNGTLKTTTQFAVSRWGAYLAKLDATKVKVPRRQHELFGGLALHAHQVC